MKIDIRNTDKKLSFKLLWIREQYEKLKLLVNPETEDEINEVKKLLLDLFDDRKIVEGRFYNNNNNSNQIMTQEQFIDIFLNSFNIMTGYLTLYSGHEGSVNIGSMALDNILKERGINKTLMMESPQGSDEYKYYKTLQSTFKILANSYYGVQGERNSFFYDPLIQNSITLTAQDLTSTSIAGLEAFIENNIYFIDTDAFISFCTNILGDTYKFNISDYLPTKTSDDVYKRYLPTFRKHVNHKIIKTFLNRLDSESLTKLYFKNNLKEAIILPKMKEIISELINTEDDSSEKEVISKIVEPLNEFCHYNHLFDERFKIAIQESRKAVIASDTDSNFINLDNIINIINKELELNHSDHKVQLKLINLMIDTCTIMLKNTFYEVTANMGIVEKYRSRINMKSEFLYKKIMLTRNKKQYAGVIIAELGKMLSKQKVDIKGLSIRKSTVPKKIRKQFTDILENDILKVEKINLRDIIKKYDNMNDEIISSLKEGKVEYSTPSSTKPVTQYNDDPTKEESVRGVLTWNLLEPEQQIVPPESVNLIKLKKLSIDAPEFEKLKETHPKKYKAIHDGVFGLGDKEPKLDFSRFGFSVIALPKTVTEIPEYLRPFIDLEVMSNKNIRNGYILLESLGVYCFDTPDLKFKSNIISL